MLKVFATNLIVSKGYENNPALKYFGENDSCVQFRVGEKVYDKDAENNTRWVNHTVKAFGAACERTGDATEGRLVYQHHRRHAHGRDLDGQRNRKARSGYRSRRQRQYRVCFGRR